MAQCRAIDEEGRGLEFEGKAYLERTGAARPTSLTADSLTDLHRRQAYGVPFENFDVLLGRGIDGVATKETLEDGPAYLDVLRDEFAIDLDAGYSELKPIVQS